MGDLFKNYGDRVKIFYKDFPLREIHPWASHAAVDANCLAVQNYDAYWAFADYVHGNPREISGEPNARKSLDQEFGALDQVTRKQGEQFKLDSDKLNACMKAQDASAVLASIKEGESVGVEATPTMFVNGRKISGALPAEELRASIDHALSDAGSPPAAPAAASK